MAVSKPTIAANSKEPNVPIGEGISSYNKLTKSGGCMNDVTPIGIV
jgi:hypothetical protein